MVLNCWLENTSKPAETGTKTRRIVTIVTSRILPGGGNGARAGRYKHGEVRAPVRRKVLMFQLLSYWTLVTRPYIHLVSPVPLQVACADPSGRNEIVTSAPFTAFVSIAKDEGLDIAVPVIE